VRGYVIIDDRDMDNLPLATAHSINIEEFVPSDEIVIRGAREHNLKDVTVTLPRDRLVVITGLSGSFAQTGVSSVGVAVIPFLCKYHPYSPINFRPPLTSPFQSSSSLDTTSPSLRS